MKKFLFFAAFIGFFAVAHNVAAGFGVSPPYVQNDHLIRGSHFEQKIILVRSDPDTDLTATVSMNIPGAQEWFSVDTGSTFSFPKGERQIPIVMRVDVPENAGLGIYRGKIDIILSAKDAKGGKVAIALGAQLDVYLEVVERAVYSFEVRGVNAMDVEEGYRWLWMFFPGKIRFSMKVQNTGNVAHAPTRVEFDIRDLNGTLLEKTINTNPIKLVGAFLTNEVVAELPTRLAAGAYEAQFRIFNNDEVAYQGGVRLSILPRGSVAGYAGYGFWGLTRMEKTILLVLVLALGMGLYQLARKPFLKKLFKKVLS